MAQSKSRESHRRPMVRFVQGEVGPEVVTAGGQQRAKWALFGLRLGGTGPARLSLRGRLC